MADLEKYLEPLKQISNENWRTVLDAITGWRFTAKARRSQTPRIRVSRMDWQALGEPPAEEDGERYIIDVSDPEVVMYMWEKSLVDVMAMGCFAASDIEQSCSMINNDNIDDILTDREALNLYSRVIKTGEDMFRDMRSHVESVIDGE